VQEIHHLHEFSVNVFSGLSLLFGLGHTLSNRERNNCRVEGSCCRPDVSPPLSWFHTRSSRWRDWVVLTELLKLFSFLPFGRRNVNNSEYSSLFIFQDSCRAQILPPSIPALPPLLASLCTNAAGGELVHRLVGRVVLVEELSEGESRNQKSASHHF